MREVSILERRRIEAEFARHVLETLSEELGAEKAPALLRRMITKMAHATGREMAALTPGNEDGRHPPDLADFAAIMPLWQRDDALRIEWIERTPEKMSFNVTRCRYAESYRAMGLGELGDTLSCNRDGEFCHGYNPAIRLERTQTIMGGASHCDFRYTLKKD